MNIYQIKMYVLVYVNKYKAIRLIVVPLTKHKSFCFDLFYSHFCLNRLYHSMLLTKGN